MAGKAPGSSPGGSGIFSRIFQSQSIFDVCSSFCHHYLCSLIAVIECSVPTIANGTSNATSISYSETVKFTCSSGFWMRGLATSNCTSNGLAAVPECLGKPTLFTLASVYTESSDVAINVIMVCQRRTEKDIWIRARVTVNHFYYILPVYTLWK